MDTPVDFATKVAADLRHEVGEWLTAVYLHGSAALGDFDPLLSDVDLLVVLDDSAPPGATASTGELLHSQPRGPGLGIEASAVSANEALHPRAPWPFLVHITTGEDNDKVVFGVVGSGDPDLILHYTVTRAAGIAIDGPAPSVAIGEIDRRLILEQLHDELLWATNNATAPYAVLNACRALRYREEGVICSKTDGGAWALNHDIAPEVVSPAVAARRASSTYRLDDRSTAWVLSVADRIATTA